MDPIIGSFRCFGLLRRRKRCAFRFYFCRLPLRRNSTNAVDLCVWVAIHQKTSGFPSRRPHQGYNYMAAKSSQFFGCLCQFLLGPLLTYTHLPMLFQLTCSVKPRFCTLGWLSFGIYFRHAISLKNSRTRTLVSSGFYPTTNCSDLLACFDILLLFCWINFSSKILQKSKEHITINDHYSYCDMHCILFQQSICFYNGIRRQDAYFCAFGSFVIFFVGE